MATVTLKHLSQSLHQELKEQAARHRRSLNQEILACLESSLHSAAVDVNALMTRARTLRGKISGPLTDRIFRRLKKEGRP